MSGEEGDQFSLLEVKKKVEVMEGFMQEEATKHQLSLPEKDPQMVSSPVLVPQVITFLTTNKNIRQRRFFIRPPRPLFLIPDFCCFVISYFLYGVLSGRYNDE